MYEVYVIKVDGRPVYAGRINIKMKSPHNTYKSKCRRFAEQYGGVAEHEVVLTTAEPGLANARVSRLTREIGLELAKSQPMNFVKRRRAFFISPKSKHHVPDFEYVMVNGTWVLKDLAREDMNDAV